MAKLAIHGGAPVRPATAKWPDWPVSDARDAQLMAKVSKSGRWSYDGELEWRFAEAFTRYQTARHGMCVANGTVALQLAIEALGIGAYDEVLVPGLTWQATASAVLDVNAVPILVDVEPDTWCIDLAAAERLVTPKTRALAIVHLYGTTCHMDQVRAFCKKHNLLLIEDCAHQHGSFWKGKGVGSFGDAGCFSFQQSKVLTSGEGGFNTCRDARVFERLYSLRNCGRPWQGVSPHHLHSGNYRLTEFQAVELLGGLGRLDAQVKRRDANAMYLNARLAQVPGVLPMKRHKQTTQQSYFNFAFRLDPAALGPVANRAFCRALNAELSITSDAYDFDQPYEPLNNCPLYQPHTKPRHKLSAAYWKAIDPRRWRLPVATGARERTGVVVHHRVLMGARKDMDDIATAVAKVMENLEALR